MGNICIIGPRGSGKTTYLAALAYYPDRQRPGKKAKNIKLQPLNDEATALADKAENIILEGASLAPTPITATIDDLPFYYFGLEVKSPLQRTSSMINIAVRDYPGEIFEELANANSDSGIHKEFMNECLAENVDGCLILLTDWSKGSDQFTSRVLARFTKLMDINGRADNLRIAIAMSKCERGELWSGRLDPSLDLFQQHFPKTKTTLENVIPAKNLQFYALSTFGVLSRNDPRPNRRNMIDSDNAVLREPEKWQPYGLIEPLYWLSKGKRLRYV